ncbi:MAG: UDP-N-acetyl-L-fucosamine synthase, partial [Thermoleophilaceae bacterium]|nr:UDP-N-acetyl-L-fucosamine synthase [Thermoleophilaceae bacterium]
MPAASAKPHVLLVLGIRPDLIRASRVIHLLRERREIEFTLLWSGQHYADNLKDVFIRELGLPRPDMELGASGDSDADVVASVIARMSPVLADM